MNAPNDLQKLWQQDNFRKENIAMWMELVQEKRTHFDDVMRAGNQAEYLVSLIFGPLLVLLAYKAKFPWVQAGYGLLAATLILLAITTWLTQRERPRQNDHSIRDHVEALIHSYDRRMRFLRSGKIWVSLPLCAGLAAVILGVPGFATSMGAWSVTGILVAGLVVSQWLSYQRAKASILKTREEAASLLRELRADD